LAPYYPEANRLCEAGDFAYQAEPDMPPILQGFAGRSFVDSGIERFSCPTDFGLRYRARLAAAPNIRVVLHASATNIASERGDVTAVEACTLGRRSLRVQATNFVLATGGLEIPRLLLASRDHHPDGLGNQNDLVGRFYMCHLAGGLGVVRPSVPVNHGYGRSEEGIYCRRRFAVTAAAQRRLRSGNLVARLHHPRVSDPSHRSGALSALVFAAPFIASEYATRLGDGRLGLGRHLRHAANVATAPRETAGFLLHWLRHRTLAARKFPSIIVRPPGGAYSLDIHAEQFPNPDSRVLLGRECDALGMRRLLVDWRHLPADVLTVRRCLQALSTDLAESKTARLDWDEETLEADLLQDGAYGGHHLGTTRMAADPRRGVVDADCRVHGTRNLWIAGGSVFPTSGQANPTLTIVALALRLAARLRVGFDNAS
jgi:choline dehydrogenase-like flavoprotein